MRNRFQKYDIYWFFSFIIAILGYIFYSIKYPFFILMTAIAIGTMFAFRICKHPER